MLWAACCLGFFSFLQAREITVNFSLVSMTVHDLQSDSLVNPTCFKAHIKSSKTDLFCMGCEAVIYMWCVPSTTWATFWLCVALLLDLSLHLVMEALLHSNSCLPQFSLSCTQLVILAPIQAIASVLGQQLRTLPGSSGSSAKTLDQWSSDAYQIYICTPVSSIVHVS